MLLLQFATSSPYFPIWMFTTYSHLPQRVEPVASFRLKFIVMLCFSSHLACRCNDWPSTKLSILFFFSVPLPCFGVIMGDFDWKSTLTTCIVSVVLVFLFRSWVVRLGKRLWGFFCTQLGLCWRGLLLRTNPRRTPDLEQHPDEHGTELNDFAVAVPAPPLAVLPPPSPSPSSSSSGRVERTSPGPAVAAAVPNFSRPLLASPSSSSPRRSTRPRRPTQFYGR